MFADVQGTLMWNVRLEGVVIIAKLQYALVPSVFYLGELLGQFEMSNVASHIFFFFFALCSSLALGVLNSIGSVVIDTLSSPYPHAPRRPCSTSTP